jgi:hypothetical protein
MLLEQLLWCSVCDPDKYFSHASLVIYFLVTQPMKLKLGHQIGEELLIKKPPGQISTMGQSETLNSSQIIFITLFFCRCTALLRLLLATANCAIMLSKNYFPKPNRYVLTFLHPISMCRIVY